MHHAVDAGNRLSFYVLDLKAMENFSVVFLEVHDNMMETCLKHRSRKWKSSMKNFAFSLKEQE